MNKRFMALFMVYILLITALTGCGQASAPVSDGVYWVSVESSSSMFRIVDCELTIANGNMTAVLTLSGTGYEKLYMGTGEQALADTDDKCVYYKENAARQYTYEIPVSALDTDIGCAAWSFRKKEWYDRILVFKSETLVPYEERPAALPDGEYTVNVTLSGGSGKATIKSPAKLTVKDGLITARVVWSSKNYTYMLIDGEKYLPVNTETDNVNLDENASDSVGSDSSDSDGSAFEIPVIFDRDIPVTAQTVAMSEPREIEYVLRFERASVMLALAYAENFTVSYAGNAPVIRFSDGTSFTVKRHPQKIYLAATSAMCSFDALNSLDALAFSGTKADGWYIENAAKAMKNGRIIYAGKYSVPDYELLLSSGCDLAVESNMLSHAPEVKEKLEALGIPVIVDMSSYETHPQGRAEWIKLYGALLGKEDLAAAIFNEQIQSLNSVLNREHTGKTIAFFYINSAGLPVVRKSGDYVAKMIELAGGQYVFDNIGDPDTATGTVTIEMETFYNAAKDADIIIYNSTIGEEIETLDELLLKNGLLKDFKAFRNGGVWCVSKNFYQETTSFGFITADMRRIFEYGEEDGLIYMRKLR